MRRFFPALFLFIVIIEAFSSLTFFGSHGAKEMIFLVKFQSVMFAKRKIGDGVFLCGIEIKIDRYAQRYKRGRTKKKRNGENHNSHRRIWADCPAMWIELHTHNDYICLYYTKLVYFASLFFPPQNHASWVWNLFFRLLVKHEMNQLKKDEAEKKQQKGNWEWDTQTSTKKKIVGQTNPMRDIERERTRERDSKYNGKDEEYKVLFIFNSRMETHQHAHN